MTGDPPAATAELAAQVWQRLFDFIVHTAAHRNRILGSHRLTPNDSRAITALDTPAGRTMGSLAEEWGCDASYATSVIDRLERRGLAARRSQPGDRRVKLVKLTARGVRTKRTLTRALYRPPAELLGLARPDLEALWLATAKLPDLQRTREDQPPGPPRPRGSDRRIRPGATGDRAQPARRDRPRASDATKRQAGPAPRRRRRTTDRLAPGE